MPTLLQINSVANYGSTGRIAEEIGQIATNNGWSSYIAYGRIGYPSLSNLIKIGTDCDVKLHGLQSRLFDRHGLGSHQATEKFILLIEKLKPDIIHLHNLHGYYINIEVLFRFLVKRNIPIVWTLHDCWPMTGHCSHFEFAKCEKWKVECSSCPQKKEYPSSIGFDRSTKNYNLKKELFTSLKQMTIVPVSNWLGDIVSQSFLQNYPLQVINNGIDTNIFKPILKTTIQKKYKLDGKFTILGVANIWSPRKGLSDFIELSKIIDENCIILLVGLISNQIKNLPINIIGISRTESTNELAELYSYADVYLNPTWEDNFPTTNLEALACGIPVVTYRTGGSIEAVSPETGFIVERGDIHGLAQAVKIIKDRGKRSFSIACRKRAKILYDKNERFQDYLNLYKSILNQNANKAD